MFPFSNLTKFPLATSDVGLNYRNIAIFLLSMATTEPPGMDLIDEACCIGYAEHFLNGSTFIPPGVMLPIEEGDANSAVDPSEDPIPDARARGCHLCS